MLSVLAPVAGVIVGLAGVPDPVFAQGMVGPGTAIEPRHEIQEATSPIAGRLVKLHPHAFVVQADEGKGILVHLGIDTVRLTGKGFELLVTEGDDVEAGRPLIRWNPADVVAVGLSPVVPIVALDAGDSVISRAIRREVEQGEQLFQWA